MTKDQAIHAFWSSFGLRAYDENSVYAGNASGEPPTMPYITYSLTLDSNLTNVSMTASLWYRSTSWLEIDAKAEEIAEHLTFNHAPIVCDNGRIWIKKGRNFAQRMRDPDDDMVRRVVLQVQVEYLTTY